ncbi:methyltransferase, FkbM family [Nitrosomonas sp. Nm51]|uniref:FkbM family methyltransferase n=1 Tax=Nitrosomonas sp. Nm51 TaxID=133720 RepID=UPI0008BA1038|nr:FkbM family methyltransferase [Nitrosomonas sp. Nm51]SER64140.1 methyltransferase, FkbM family [Nitrosomonas sp. Nm51]
MLNFFKNCVIAFYQLIGGFTRTTVRGVPIRIAVDHWRVLKRARTYSVKEPDTLDWLDQFKPDSCYFDIGANIGQYSLYPAKKYGKSVQVFAFEPQSNNYYSLNKNIFINNLADTIAAYCIAVSGKTGFSKLYIPKFIPGGNRSQFGREDVANMKIPTTHVQGMLGVTLDDLCGVWGFPCPNYMKIDVDGIEISILTGAENVLKNPRLVSVIIELGTAKEQEAAVQLMHAAGFEVKHKTAQNWGETCFIFERLRA